ncbi:unnamed protein product [Sphagnum troendelagicum]|uniref:Uncharacterized protein n=1 Tax=Sphagnum troendelagicum TaxID=128251 RepID=A0ABP0V4B5_9BRYO
MAETRDSEQQGCRSSSTSLGTSPKHLVSSAGLHADYHTVLIGGAIWERKPANDSTEPVATQITWRELKGEKAGCSPHAVLEGPGSRTDSEGNLSTSNSHHEEWNEWSTSSSRKGLSNGSSTNEDETGACDSVPQQKQGKPRLWKSFAQKQWE